MLFFYLLSQVPTPYAQNTLKGPLALKECLQIALENSSKIAIAKRGLITAQLEVKDARAGYLPRLDTSAGYKVNDTYNKVKWTEDHYDTKLSLKETFYDNGKTLAQTKQAKARLEASQVNFQKIKNELIFEVTKSYYGLLKAQKMLQVKDEGLKQAQAAHLDLARARYEVGTAPQFDILKAEVEVSSAELGLIEAENTLSLARADLNNVMGIDLNASLLIVDTEDNLKPIFITLDECLSQALQARPEIRKAEINLQIDEIDLKLARKEVWPEIKLEGNYHIDVDQLIDKNDWKKSAGWEIDFKISLPIFDAGKAKRGATKAMLELENTMTNKD